MIKDVDLEKVTKEYLDDRNHTLITDNKISIRFKGYLAQF